MSTKPECFCEVNSGAVCNGRECEAKAACADHIRNVVEGVVDAQIGQKLESGIQKFEIHRKGWVFTIYVNKGKRTTTAVVISGRGLKDEYVRGMTATTVCVPEDEFTTEEGVRRAIRKVVAKAKSGAHQGELVRFRQWQAFTNSRIFDPILGQPAPEQATKNRKRWLESKIKQYHAELGRLIGAATVFVQAPGKFNVKPNVTLRDDYSLEELRCAMRESITTGGDAWDATTQTELTLEALEDIIPEHQYVMRSAAQLLSARKITAMDIAADCMRVRAARKAKE